MPTFVVKWYQVKGQIVAIDRFKAVKKVISYYLRTYIWLTLSTAPAKCLYMFCAICKNQAIERLQCHPGKSGGHVFSVSSVQLQVVNKAARRWDRNQEYYMQNKS